MEVKVHHACVVCGETSDQVALHYTRLLCNGCRAFFKRTVQGKVKIPECKSDGQCVVNHSSRKACKACRYDACMRAGVDSSKVQQPREGSHDTSLDETQFYIQHQKMLHDGRSDLTSLNWSTNIPVPHQTYDPQTHFLQPPQPTANTHGGGVYQVPNILNLALPSMGIRVLNQYQLPSYPAASYHDTASCFDNGKNSIYGSSPYVTTADVTNHAFCQWQTWNKGHHAQPSDPCPASTYHNPSAKSDFLTSTSNHTNTSSYDPMWSYFQESLGLTTGQYLQYLQHQLPGYSSNHSVPTLVPKAAPTMCDGFKSGSHLTSDLVTSNVKKEVADTDDVECLGQSHSASKSVIPNLGVTKSNLEINSPPHPVSFSDLDHRHSNGDSVTSLPLGADNEEKKSIGQMFFDSELSTRETLDANKPGEAKSKKSSAFMIDALLKGEPNLKASTSQEFCPFIPVTFPSSFPPVFPKLCQTSEQNVNTAPVQWRPIPIYPTSSLNYNYKASADTPDGTSVNRRPDDIIISDTEHLSDYSASRNTQSTSSGDSYPSSPESGNGFFPSEAELKGISPFVTKCGLELLASDEDSQDMFIDCETVDGDKQETVDIDKPRVKEDAAVAPSGELSTHGGAVVDSGLGSSGASSTATDSSTLPENKENEAFQLKRKRDNSLESRRQPAKRLRYRRWPLRQRRGPGYTSTPVAKTALGLKVKTKKCTCSCVCQGGATDST